MPDHERWVCNHPASGAPLALRIAGTLAGRNGDHAAGLASTKEHVMPRVMVEGEPVVVPPVIAGADLLKVPEVEKLAGKNRSAFIVDPDIIIRKVVVPVTVEPGGLADFSPDCAHLSILGLNQTLKAT
jgi:hypothetical protein